VLEAGNCRGLRTLPDSVGELAALETIGLALCVNLTALPESLARLASLTSLDVRMCESLAALPDLSPIKGLRLRDQPKSREASEEDEEMRASQLT